MSKDNVRRFTLSFVWFAKWVLAPLILGALVIAGGVALYQQRIDFDTFLNYFALGLLIFVVITLFYGIIAIHDVPYEIAKTRPSASRCNSCCRLGEPIYPARALAVSVDLGDAVPARSRLGVCARISLRVLTSPSQIDDLLRRVEQLESKWSVLTSRQSRN